MSLVNFEPKSEQYKLRCTSCGATTEAPCDCGVPYALLTPRAKARIAVKETPQLSNKAIAQRIGVSDVTVGTARRELLPQNNFAESGRGVNVNGVDYTRKSPWTPEKDAELMALYKEGKSGKEISEILNITPSTASSRVHRLANIRPDLETHYLPPEMPEDILVQVDRSLSPAIARMHEVNKLSFYVDQMHEDVRQRIAEEVQVVYNLSRDIIRRLVGGARNIKAPACGIDIKLRKDEE